nr:hypothetical protein [uncultured Desulfuromonas sp.]
MQPIKRAAFTLEILSLWAILTLLISAVIIRVVYKLDISIFPTLVDDITNITDAESLQKLCVMMREATTRDKDLGWLLATWGISLVALWSGIFGIAAIYLARLLRHAEQNPAQQESQGMLEQAINKELPLWMAFWILYIAVPYILTLLTQGLIWGLKHYHIIETAQLADLMITPLTQGAILTLWLWAAMVTWNCASNTGHTVWKYSARAIVIFHTVLPTIISVGVLSYILWIRSL